VSDIQVAYLEETADQQAANQHHLGLLIPNQSQIAIESVTLKSLRFYMAVEGKCQRNSIEAVLNQLSQRFDISEPFSRIVEALLEAHPLIKSQSEKGSDPLVTPKGQPPFRAGSKSAA
jgi:hypothetical protein